MNVTINLTFYVTCKMYIYSRVFSEKLRGYADFVADFRSRIWFTYRRRIKLGKFQTDAGWGCMLRSGQMLLAEAFLRHCLGREWRLPALRTPRQLLPAKYMQLLSLFADRQSGRYSIHAMCNTKADGDQCLTMTPGQWFGPTPVAGLLWHLMNRHAKVVAARKAAAPPCDQVGIVVANDGIVALDTVHLVCTSQNGSSPVHVQTGGETGPSGGPLLSKLLCGGGPRATAAGGGKWRRSLLLVVPMRLGLQQLNTAYTRSLSAALRFPQSVGLIGGKPGRSLFFVGTHGDRNAVYLDPHTVHVSPLRESHGYKETCVGYNNGGASGEEEAFARVIESYHCQRPRSLPIDGIDPSLALAFYCRNAEDFCDFCARAQSDAESMSLDAAGATSLSSVPLPLRVV